VRHGGHGNNKMTAAPQPEGPGTRFRRILGVRFFVGEAREAIELLRGGGLLVVPAAPALKNLLEDSAYREALLEADVALADSSLMVLIWNFMQRDRIRRLSGLEYLVELLHVPAVKTSGGSFWIMASRESADRNLAWLETHGVCVPAEDVYVAPRYGSGMDDEILVQKIRARRPLHVIVTIGGGTQERLGLYLKRNLEPLPAIHCIGAAIAFLSGDQVRIPLWADRWYLGWLFRCLSEPRRFVPRYWSARQLISLLVRFREGLPVRVARQL
jgi:UDP-N-acetyl-D-mannosaminuronic acid transferase (WecB/TagA/CpsF family)